MLCILIAATLQMLPVSAERVFVLMHAVDTFHVGFNVQLHSHNLWEQTARQKKSRGHAEGFLQEAYS